MQDKISWWRTEFGEEEIQRVVHSLRNECISQGKVTAEFELKLSEFLEVENVIAVSSGSSALLMALMAVGIGPGDEVIIPNRTWIATAHAVHLLGAKVILVDVEPERPIIDVSKIESKLTEKTKAIIPVHMNGRSADMGEILKLARANNIAVIEDAAQAISSRNADGFLGTQSDIGCFSLSVAKTISTGQGGFAVTANTDLAKTMRAIRTHGVENTVNPNQWVMPGFNFRFTDLQASIGIEQLKKLPERANYLRELYAEYLNGLNGSPFKVIPVDIDAGEIPVYNEFLVEGREQWAQKLCVDGIEIRPFYPNIDTAPYLSQNTFEFPNSRKYGLNGIYLPSGPAQSIDSIKHCIHKIKESSL